VLRAPAPPAPFHPAPPFPAREAVGAPALVGTCPRCGYHGEGVPYFSRGGHVAALVGLSLFTAGMMGIGGVAYYLFRREHQVCPRCGFGWGPLGERVQLRSGVPAPVAVSRGGESFKRGWAILLFVLAAILAVVGVLNTALPVVLVAGGAAAGGLLLQRAAERDREARRAAMISSLQLPVLRLAAERQGRLTVTEVAAALEWPLRRAEKVLESLEDGFRVSSEVTDEGLIVYEFRELLAPPDGGPSGARRVGPPPA
jgi:hypothetical protein